MIPKPSSLQVFTINDFGAVGDGQTLNTRSLQKAAEACKEAGGGVVRVPEGVFVTGTFEIFSNTTLLIEKNGTLRGSSRLEDRIFENLPCGILVVRDAHDVTLTGEGTIDGNADGFFDENLVHGSDEDFSDCDTWQKRNGLPHGSKETVHGPFVPRDRPGNMVVFARCQNVRIEKIRLTGSPYWTLHCADCSDLLIENLRIENSQMHPNDDGIHLTSCRNSKIRNCKITCGDDAIAITGFSSSCGEKGIQLGLSGLVGSCENIEVSDCILKSRSGGIRIGYGPNPVRGVYLKRLEIRDSNRGIGIFARQADVEDIVIEDCRIETKLVHGNWWGRGEPIHLSAVRFPGDPELFHIRRVTFRNIEAIGENAVALFSEEPGFIDQIKMKNVKSTLRRGDLFETWGGNLDLRPVAHHPLSFVAGGTVPLWVIGVTGIQLDDCQWILDQDAGSHFSSQPVFRERL